ncbi:MAG: peptidylprolyl isomerase, partial [Anaerolineaceae bacterium]|nr:peptidylprolyl isomerase [Anaerolineaceae bacterium]
NKTNRERREKEEKQTKMLRLGGMIVGGIVIVCIIAGLILGIVNKPTRKTVAKVGDVNITLDEFQQAVRMQRSNINSNYQYMQQLYAMFGMEIDEQTRESYAVQMSDSYKGLLGQNVLSNMVDQRVMAYGAEKEGISVSDEEVDNYYQGLFAYYPNGTPTATATNEPFEATPTISEEQLAILRYTETPLPTDVPTEEPVENDNPVGEVSSDNAVETVAEEVSAESTEFADAVEEAVSKSEEAVEESVEEAENLVNETVEKVEEVLSDTAAEPTAEPTAAPTATPYTEDMFKQFESVYFANNFYYSKDFFKNQLRYELLQDKVENYLKEGIARTADMVWARHILVETEEEAQAALDRINAGEEWGDVCAEVSTDTSNASNAGDLGWFMEGAMVQPFNDVAFSQEIGTISEPVQTDFGWHLIQVIGHEVRPLTSTQYDNAVSSAYQQWLDSYTEQLDINLDGYNVDMVPTDPAFVG